MAPIITPTTKNIPYHLFGIQFPQDQEPPKPMPMAIMRNAHEVVRGAMQQIQLLLLEEEEDFQKAAQLYQDLDRYQKLHMAMEEGTDASQGKPCLGLFALMDEKAENAATNAGLRQQHEGLDTLETQVRTAFAENQLESLKDLFPKFVQANEAHLVLEEKVLMPSIQTMMKAGVPMKKHIKTDLLPAILYDMEFFVQFSCRSLEAYEKQQPQQQQPKTRVFCQALWAVASPTEWKQWKEWMKCSLSANKYNAVMGAIEAFQMEQNSAWC